MAAANVPNLSKLVINGSVFYSARLKFCQKSLDSSIFCLDADFAPNGAKDLLPILFSPTSIPIEKKKMA